MRRHRLGHRLQAWTQTPGRQGRWRTIKSCFFEADALLFARAYAAERSRDGEYQYFDLRIVQGARVVWLMENREEALMPLPTEERLTAIEARLSAVELAQAHAQTQEPTP